MEAEQNPQTVTSEVAKRSELGTKIEIDAKNAIIRSLREEKKKMFCKIRELADKVDLHQDELTDLKELFITVNKENDIKANKVKKLEVKVEALRSLSLVNRDVNTEMDAFGELVDEIEKDVLDENENHKIASNNE